MREVGRRRVAALRAAAQSALQHLEEPGRHARTDVLERVHLAVADREEDGQLTPAGKERTVQQDLREHRAEAEEVRAVIARLTRDLLRCEVGELPLEHVAGLAPEGRARGGACDPEVPELHLPVLRQVDVRRRHVAVHDAERAAGERISCSMHAFQRTQDLARDVDGDPDGEQLVLLAQAPQETVAVDAVDVLHRQVGLSARVDASTEHGDDVVMRDRCVEPSLALEHRAALGVGGEVGQQSLDDQLVGQPGVGRRRVRQIDLGRPADRDARVEKEGAEAKRGGHSRLRTQPERVAISGRYVTNPRAC